MSVGVEKALLEEQFEHVVSREEKSMSETECEVGRVVGDDGHKDVQERIFRGLQFVVCLEDDLSGPSERNVLQCNAGSFARLRPSRANFSLVCRISHGYW